MTSKSGYILKTAEHPARGGAPTEQELAQINTHALRTLLAAEVFVFSLTLCDNEIDRDGERFDTETLKELAPMFVGKSGIFDHEAVAKNQTARIFSCSVKSDSGKKTAAGEAYCCITARAYMLRSEKNGALISEIEAGIKKEVSVGCAVRQVVCSVCAEDVRRMPCAHRIGERQADGSVCHRILSGALDAYEWSFVAVPAQRAAGVTKASDAMKGGRSMQEILKRLGSETIGREEGERLRAYISELSEMAGYGKAYREEIENEVMRMMYAKNAAVDCGVLKAAVQGMPLAALRELGALFAGGDENYLANASQLYRKGEQGHKDTNTEFRI